MSEKRDNAFTLSKQDPSKVKYGNDYSGTAIINGQEYWLNAKTNSTQDGRECFTGTLKLKQPKNYGEKNDTTRRTTQEQPPEYPEDRIPF